MKKQILVTACSMEVGGIERSTAGLINSIDYEKYDVDLLLFSRKGEFMPLLTDKCNILPEISQCATLLKPISEVIKSGHPIMATSRVFSKIRTKNKFRSSDFRDDALVFAHLQSMWDNSVMFMPALEKEYDVVMSFMWPHHYVAKKVKGKTKIAWVHTDYSNAALDNGKDEKVWNKFDYIAAVSDECANAFKKIYPSFSDKVVTIENVLPTEFVKEQSDEFDPEEMKTQRVKILTAGRFCYAKAYDKAVEICKLLVDKGLDINWYALGYGTLESEIKQKVQELGLEERFIFLGKKINPYPYMKSCDIYVQPSRYEGKAVTVREAQMLGKPVVITNFKTAESQVKNGFDAIVSPMENEAVAKYIQKLIEDEALRKRLSENSLKTDYSNIEYIDKLFELIEAGE